jgi:serine/threonine-protein kinase
MSPRRWQEFERALTAAGGPKDAQPMSAEAAAAEIATHKHTKTPTPLPKDPDELTLPFELGDYKLTERIGKGGMGSVYKSVQKGLRRYVAVKVLLRKFGSDPAFVERFQREARAAAACNHPNIVVPIAIGSEKGLHYYAMEFIEGENLGQWLEKSDRLPWKDALEVALQVTKGLEYSHKHGIVHRDIKPDNILVDKDSGLAKILDLGLVKRDKDRGVASKAGGTVGTPYYIAPEQARAETVDGRADIYSLGATLWHLLVGVVPFDGPNGGVIMAKHLTEPVPDPRVSVEDLPESVSAIVMQMMAKDPDDRYADCEELRVDLEAALAGKPLKYAETRGPGESARLKRSLNLHGGGGGSRAPGASHRPRVSQAPSLSRAGQVRLQIKREEDSVWIRWGLIAGLLGVALLGFAAYMFLNKPKDAGAAKEPPAVSTHNLPDQNAGAKK